MSPYVVALKLKPSYGPQMNGTLALWYESNDASPQPAGAESPLAPEKAEFSAPKEAEAALRESAESRLAALQPRLRLHVNLWRDLDKQFNFLDVGLLLTQVEKIDRIYLYLPTHINAGDVFDLSGALKDVETLNAVFNEVSTLVRDKDRYFIVKSKPVRLRAIYKLNVTSDISIDTVSVPGKPNGTIIALNNSICSDIVGANKYYKEHYIRLRIFLKGPAQNLFSTEDRAASVGLALTQDILETTEFRLNERRSFPPDVLQRTADGQFFLESIHYFLIRSRDYQLSSQHQNFRKVRRLEDEIWSSYLSVGKPTSRPHNRSTEGMTIYQWRELAGKKNGEDQTIDDFIAYASFRTGRPRIWTYLIAILAIGGVGGAILNVVLSVLGRSLRAAGFPQLGPGYANLIAGSLLAIVALAPMVAVWIIQAWKRRQMREPQPFRQR
ncbi:hypothetical protein [Methylobacterium sp. Leaf88]|uniref:hypothetical protein n=1 Tax=Methylobacterium sp. Leaf88 TaxID=1736244 RepID=UPI0012E8A872|nr:hypothetical protein [Methylobacterium sp. Leaf88]